MAQITVPSHGNGPTTNAAEPGDGRNHRRTRNIDLAVDAMLGLLAQGRLWPTAAEVAHQAGLSERSVFRYFEDLDALALVAVDTQIQRADHLFTTLPADGSRAERIDRLVDHRLHLHDEVGAIVLAARLRASLNETIAEGLAQRHRQLRQQLRELFAPELAGELTGDDDLLTALEITTGLDALHALRTDRACSPDQARRILHRTATALLDGRALDP